MDKEALKRDLGRLTELLPPTFLAPMAQAIYQHRDHLERVFPEIVQLIAPHARAGMVEGGAGIFDWKELEEVIAETMAEFGMPPEMLSALLGRGSAGPCVCPRDATGQIATLDTGCPVHGGTARQAIQNHFNPEPT